MSYWSWNIQRYQITPFVRFEGEIPTLESQVKQSLCKFDVVHTCHFNNFQNSTFKIDSWRREREKTIVFPLFATLLRVAFNCSLFWQNFFGKSCIARMHVTKEPVIYALNQIKYWNVTFFSIALVQKYWTDILLSFVLLINKTTESTLLKRNFFKNILLSKIPPSPKQTNKQTIFHDKNNNKN